MSNNLAAAAPREAPVSLAGAPLRRRRPGPMTLLRTSGARAHIELLGFFRGREAVFFTLALPVIMMVLFASIFTGYVPGTHVQVSQLYAAGLMAGGIGSTCFLYLTVNIATERDSGALKRLAGTPMPRAAYFLGKAASVMVTAILEVVLVLIIGHLFYHVALPSSMGRWFTFTWVTLLGTACMALTGVAMSSVPRSSRSATAVANLPLLVLEFVSGIFIPFTSLPSGLYKVAGIFPLKWLAQGYRSALLPSYFQRAEPGHNWDHALMALVLGAWCVTGLAVSLKTFRWLGNKER